MLIVNPSGFFPRCTQSGSSIEGASFFWKKRMSVTTSVPALARKAFLGNRMAPNNTARSARYRRASEPLASMVYREVTKAITPPGRSLSRVLAKK